MNFLARVIVFFLKKYKLNIHDWSQHGRDQWMWFYNLFYTEYKDKLKNVTDLEVGNVDSNYAITIEYSYKTIKLDINDLSWFLTRNRYLLNKNCKNSWSYYNQTYTFEKYDDYLIAKNLFMKDYTII